MLGHTAEGMHVMKKKYTGMYTGILKKKTKKGNAKAKGRNETRSIHDNQ